MRNTRRDLYGLHTSRLFVEFVPSSLVLIMSKMDSSSTPEGVAIFVEEQLGIPITFTQGKHRCKPCQPIKRYIIV